MPNKKNSPTSEAMKVLYNIFELEMAGIVRYLHYSFMIMGHNRIPIQNWLRNQAKESMQHATIVGEKITSYGGHPPLIFSKIEETEHHSIDAILKECLAFEEEGLELYKKLIIAAKNDIALEEFGRSFISLETEHLDDIKKMLRRE